MVIGLLQLPVTAIIVAISVEGLSDEKGEDDPRRTRSKEKGLNQPLLWLHRRPYAPA